MTRRVEQVEGNLTKDSFCSTMVPMFARATDTVERGR